MFQSCASLTSIARGSFFYITHLAKKEHITPWTRHLITARCNTVYATFIIYSYLRTWQAGYSSYSSCLLVFIHNLTPLCVLRDSILAMIVYLFRLMSVQLGFASEVFQWYYLIILKELNLESLSYYTASTNNGTLLIPYHTNGDKGHILFSNLQKLVGWNLHSENVPYTQKRFCNITAVLVMV